MQWSADRNAGFSRSNPQRLYLPVIIDPEYHYEAYNVEAQQNNPSSLLWWMKRLIALRKRFKAFGRGTLRFLEPANHRVLAFLREHADERILIVANLSRFAQHVDLEAPDLAGLVPEELFGNTLLPPIGDRPYPLTLGPHGFYWFSLRPARPGSAAEFELGEIVPTLVVRQRADEVFLNSNRDRLEALLPDFMRRRQGGRGAVITAVRIEDVSPVSVGEHSAWFLLLHLEFREGIPENVFLPLTIVPSGQEGQLLEPADVAGLARLHGGAEGLLCDALAVPAYGQAALQAIAAGASFPMGDADVVCVPLPGVAELAGATEPSTELLRSDRDNVTVRFGSHLIYKTFRRLEEGTHPDLELGRFLTERTEFTGFAPLVGYVEFRRRRRRAPATTLAVLHRFVPNQGTAWQFTLDHLSSYFERLAALSREQAAATPDLVTELMGSFPGTVRHLGQRTAEMHRALASGEGIAFAPEPFARLYQRSLYQSLRNLTARVCSRLAREKARLSEAVRSSARAVLLAQGRMLDRFHAVLDADLTSQRIRCHGDLHLGQLLYTGTTFVVMDFAGDPGRTISERRLKRSPLRDVATLVQSFDYAAESVLGGLSSGKGRPPGLVRSEDRATLAPWAGAWRDRACEEFVAGYLEAMRDSGLLPATDAASRKLLDLFVLEAALIQLAGELNNRPDWVVIPLRAVLRLLGVSPG
jgi:maltose alpha-D-glucosyltransferase/alpha-amylase